MTKSDELIKKLEELIDPAMAPEEIAKYQGLVDLAKGVKADYTKLGKDYLAATNGTGTKEEIKDETAWDEVQKNSDASVDDFLDAFKEKLETEEHNKKGD